MIIRVRTPLPVAVAAASDGEVYVQAGPANAVWRVSTNGWMPEGQLHGDLALVDVDPHVVPLDAHVAVLPQPLTVLLEGQ